MTARGRLYYQYLKNRDGSHKAQRDIKAKLIESFTVPKEAEDEIDMPIEFNIPDKVYFLDYTFENNKAIRIMFHHDGLMISSDDDMKVISNENLVGIEIEEKRGDESER